MKILITGSSSGIGLASAKKFLVKGHTVYGIDLKEASIVNKNYIHFVCDISKDVLPDIDGIDVIFNNAGLQGSYNDIDNNLKGTINVTEKYISPSLKSVLFNASASAISGSEYPLYVASKAGIVGYMKHIAVRLAPKKVTVNAISPGGVLTKSNAPVINDKKLWDEIMNVTPMKKWAEESEIAEWVYFLTITNKSMSGQNILIDNGEYDLKQNFVWPD